MKFLYKGEKPETIFEYFLHEPNQLSWGLTCEGSWYWGWFYSCYSFNP